MKLLAGMEFFNRFIFSSEYGQYAKERLTDKNCQVNIERMLVAKRLSTLYITGGFAIQMTVIQAISLSEYGTEKCEACNVIAGL